MKRVLLLVIASLQLAGPVRHAFAAIPVSGRPVPELQEDLGEEMNFDNLMTGYMEEHEIIAGVLGVMKDGKIDSACLASEIHCRKTHSSASPVVASQLRLLASGSLSRLVSSR